MNETEGWSMVDSVHRAMEVLQMPMNWAWPPWFVWLLVGLTGLALVLWLVVVLPEWIRERREVLDLLEGAARHDVIESDREEGES